ncbi:hypothetical protein VNO77_27400 [Canavalia gladiata]|uniref:Uncharacterized protein n=1 Tax=Canavalia gladiata TaxID=3824 RepID=A0AAN9QAG8_CANGL
MVITGSHPRPSPSSHRAALFLSLATLRHRAMVAKVETCLFCSAFSIFCSLPLHVPASDNRYRILSCNGSYPNSPLSFPLSLPPSPSLSSTAEVATASCSFSLSNPNTSMPKLFFPNVLNVYFEFLIFKG